MSWDYNDISATKVVFINSVTHEQFVTDKISAPMVKLALRGNKPTTQDTNEEGVVVASLPEMYRGLPDFSVFLQADYEDKGTEPRVFPWLYSHPGDIKIASGTNSNWVSTSIALGSLRVSPHETSLGDRMLPVKVVARSHDEGRRLAEHGGVTILLKTPK